MGHTYIKRGVGGAWPANYHIIGKDIHPQIPLHLLASLLDVPAGLPLPQKIVSHAHWTRGRM